MLNITWYQGCEAVVEFARTGIGSDGCFITSLDDAG
jgi:hypothetical protein